VSRRQDYRRALRALRGSEWTAYAAYLRQNSGLPGPRANLELAQAVAEESTPAEAEQLLDSEDEYMVMCGTIALGRDLATGDPTAEERLRSLACDPRWRVREGVAMALQRLGDSDLSRLFDLAETWAGDDDPLVQRAALAGVCEPRLLSAPEWASRAVRLCEGATTYLTGRSGPERRTAGVRTLRQALGYCWSVAVAADPEAGLPRFRALSSSRDPDLAWIARENAKKTRLAKLL